MPCYTFGARTIIRRILW